MLVDIQYNIDLHYVIILDVAKSAVDWEFLVTVMSVRSCVTLSKLHLLSGPHFPHPCNK